MTHERSTVLRHERCWTPGTPVESFDYDDGNLTADGTYTYVWDAENRLAKVQTRLDLGNPDDPDDGDKMLEFKQIKGDAALFQTKRKTGSRFAMTSERRTT